MQLLNSSFVSYTASFLILPFILSGGGSPCSAPGARAQLGVPGRGGCHFKTRGPPPRVCQSYLSCVTVADRVGGLDFDYMTLYNDIVMYNCMRLLKSRKRQDSFWRLRRFLRTNMSGSPEQLVAAFEQCCDNLTVDPETATAQLLALRAQPNALDIASHAETSLPLSLSLRGSLSSFDDFR